MKSASQSEIEEALTCQCGCGLTVHSCNHVQCPSAIPLKAEIAAQLAEGKGKPEVLQYFAVKYGEKVLSAPTTSGFNIVAWVTPFAVVLIATVIITVVTRRWSARGVRSEPAVPSPTGEPGDEEQRARLRAELERFDA